MGYRNYTYRKHNIGNYRISLMEYATMADIELIHPDHGSEFYLVSFNSEDEPDFGADEEEWKAFNQAVRKAIEEQYNHSGYWHEVKITLMFVVDGEVYRKEI